MLAGQVKWRMEHLTTRCSCEEGRATSLNGDYDNNRRQHRVCAATKGERRDTSERQTPTGHNNIKFLLHFVFSSFVVLCEPFKVEKAIIINSERVAMILQRIQGLQCQLNVISLMV